MRSSRVFLPSYKRTAGELVNHETALTYSAVWRAVNLISESIACLPWTIRERKRENGRTVTEPLYKHPAYNLLDLAPNDETDAFQFRQAMIAHGLTWGNGYAEITRDRSQRPAELWLIEPDRVRIDRDENGRIIYEVTNGAGKNSIIPAADMFHLKGPGFDGLVGYSVISYAARSIGLGMATEQFGADFFSNGANPSMILQHPGKLGDDAVRHLKESIQTAVSGRNKLSPFVLEEGMSVEKWTIPPEDAQFLETRKFNIAEVARWFGVPLHKLHEMEKSTFNNIEQQNIEFVTGSLLTWIKRLECEANIKLISRQMRGRVYSKINLNAMLRGDTSARGEWYKSMREMGVFSANDILELEDRNPIGPEGDKRLVQLNLTTLERVGENEQFNSNAAPTPAMDQPPGGPDSAENSAPGSKIALVGEVVKKATARQLSRVNDALQNKKTLKEFTDYLEKFGADQAKYWRNGLEDQASDEVIAGLVQAMKIKAVDCFNNRAEYDPDDIEEITSEIMMR